MRRCCSVASTPLHLVKEITLQCWLFYLDPIIIFLSDKSRPNRVRAEGSGANWGMRCGDRALHLGLCDRRTRAGCSAAPDTEAADEKSPHADRKEMPQRARIMRVGYQGKGLYDDGRGRSRGNAVLHWDFSNLLPVSSYKDVCRHILDISDPVA